MRPGKRADCASQQPAALNPSRHRVIAALRAIAKKAGPDELEQIEKGQ